MRYPKFLSPGDRIAVAAPSFSITEEEDIERFENARYQIGERGYDTVVTESVIGDEKYTPVDVRNRELESLFGDDSVSYIVAAKGGDTENEMLDTLDWDILDKVPKWIQGYSDNTNLLFKYTVDHDVATLYGSHFGDYGMEPWHRSVIENLEFLEGDRVSQRSFPYHEVSMGGHGVSGGYRDEAPTIWSSSSGDISFRGRLIGGCMDILNEFVRSDKADVPAFVNKYSDDGIIWYMETYDMSFETVREMFDLMDEKGWLNNVSGFVFGRPLVYEGDYEKDILKVLSRYDVPKVFGADVGHLAPRMLFINGAVAEFSIRHGSCMIGYQFC